MSSSCKEKKVVKTDKAPPPIGPYSAAIQAGPFVFTAGQIGIDPATGNIVSGGIQAQTKQVLNNIKALLEAAGCGMKDVIKTTVFMTDLNEFGAMNTIYGEYFVENPPARTTVQIAALPKAAILEIEAVAILPGERDC